MCFIVGSEPKGQTAQRKPSPPRSNCQCWILVAIRSPKHRRLSTISSKSMLEIWKTPDNQAEKATASSLASLETSLHHSGLGGREDAQGTVVGVEALPGSFRITARVESALKTSPFDEPVGFAAWICPLPARIHAYRMLAWVGAMNSDD